MNILQQHRFAIIIITVILVTGLSVSQYKQNKFIYFEQVTNHINKNKNYGADSINSTNSIPYNMALHGVFINSKTQTAYISADAFPQKMFHIGQHIIGNIYLQSIFEGLVIVRNKNNELITLRLKQSNSQNGSDKILSYHPPAALPAHTSAAALKPVEGIKRIQPNYHQVKRSLIKQELDSGDIFFQAKILPEEGGGFFVERIKEGSVIEALGLHVGDTIHAVNNKQLKTITDALNLYDQLDTIKTLEVNVSRANQIEHLYYELN